jgi:hypothetical protein
VTAEIEVRRRTAQPTDPADGHTRNDGRLFSINTSTARLRDYVTPGRRVAFPGSTIRNATQEATQQVGSGDDAPLRTPHQDQIVVDNVVVRPFLHNLQAPNDVAEPRLHIPYDDLAGASTLPYSCRAD